MSEKIETQKVITEPFNYGYQPGTIVSMNGQLFAALMQLAGSTAQAEIQEKVILNTFSLKTGPAVDASGQVIQPEETVQISTSPKGKRAEELFKACMDLHMQNINSGIALEEKDMVEAGPKLDLGK